MILSKSDKSDYSVRTEPFPTRNNLQIYIVVCLKFFYYIIDIESLSMQDDANKAANYNISNKSSPLANLQ